MHATLRLPRAVGKADREGMVQDLLNSMGLEQVQENQVRSWGEGSAAWKFCLLRKECQKVK